MEPRIDSSAVARAITGACFVVLLTGSAAAQATSLVTLDAQGEMPNDDAFDAAISDDGRYVAYFWYQGFVRSDVVLADRVTGAYELVSVSSNEVRGDNYSYAPSLTPDLRFIAFSSWSTNLVAGDTNGPYPNGHDCFVRDRVAGTTERVSVGPAAVQGNGQSTQPSISADGRYVAFLSDSTNLVAGDVNGVEDVFLHDRVSGTTELVSVGAGGVPANGASAAPSISADGRWVVFNSDASNLVALDTNGTMDVFLRDRVAGTTERISVSTGGTQGAGRSDSGAISPDGRYVVFRSFAADLVSGDTNGKTDIFLRDRQSGTTERVSVASGGAEPDGDCILGAITPDARFVAFQSRATNLVAGDTNGRADVFVRDRQLATTQRVSVRSDGVQGNHESGVQGVAISASGREVAFDSRANLVAGDVNTWHDVYVRDRRYEPLELVCVPGTGGVIACPCSNPPGGPDRGCDNGAATGGATLTASGIAYLSADTLVLSTGGQGPTSTSLVVQGDASSAAGAVFGHGVRCVDGTLRRLYLKTASGGGVSAPDFGAGDPTISTRSALLGDSIQAGQTRWYFVYYRDPAALGGCSATSTFNATPAGRVVWLP